MACTACGKELVVGAKFCRHCGAGQVRTIVDTGKSASVARENTCGKCGADFVATAKFCRSCGAARTQAAESASSQQPSEPVLTHVVVPPITANIAERLAGAGMEKSPSGRATNKRLIVVAIAILVASGFGLNAWMRGGTEKVENVKSDSMSFSGAVLGEKVKVHSYGEALEIDGGPYYFSKNHLHLAYDGRGNNFSGLEEPIANIGFACRDGAFGKSKGAVAIDGISCDSNVNEVIKKDGWQKFCYLHSFDPLDKPLPLMLRRNNAYIRIQFDESSNPYIDEIGITLRKVVLRKIYQNCEAAEKMKIIARQKGFKSLGDMMNPNPDEGG